MPILSPSSVENTPGQVTRLKLTGHTQLSGRLVSQQEDGSTVASSSFDGMLHNPDFLKLTQQGNTKT